MAQGKSRTVAPTHPNPLCFFPPRLSRPHPLSHFFSSLRLLYSSSLLLLRCFKFVASGTNRPFQGMTTNCQGLGPAPGLTLSQSFSPDVHGLHSPFAPRPASLSLSVPSFLATSCLSPPFSIFSTLTCFSHLLALLRSEKAPRIVGGRADLPFYFEDAVIGEHTRTLGHNVKLAETFPRITSTTEC